MCGMHGNLKEVSLMQRLMDNISKKRLSLSTSPVGRTHAVDLKKSQDNWCQVGEQKDVYLDRWEALNLYLEHGRLEIDNNLVENAIRPTAIGKKNFLFFGSLDSG